ncbi:hypothetical protein ACK345_01010 [Aeromonas rivipollensis]|uniref:Uncharacterized protein n=1 Tax=Aeromonas rivipollensis TaxID=948519 RepID=A0AAW9YDB5_9GAMM|nr:hypothetical protein [Aeromonas rivipollensis]NEX76215.1 hypothetical protein [Aeromonas rivipollensis]
MKTVAEIRKLLNELIEVTSSPVYMLGIEILEHLEACPQQKYITVGGLRAALSRKIDDDSLLIQAAFTLTSYPFEALVVRYKLYDEDLYDVLEEFDHITYMKVISDGRFIDSEGDEYHIDTFQSRTYPYFINNFAKKRDRRNIIMREGE